MASQPPTPDGPVNTPVDDPVPTPTDPTPPSPSDPVTGAMADAPPAGTDPMHEGP